MAEETILTAEQAQAADKLLGALNSGSFDGVFTAQELPSVIKMILEMANDAHNVFLRGDFADDEMALAATRHGSKCRDFNDLNGEKELLETISARCAIRGKRIDIAARCAAPQYQSPKAGGGAGQWLKKRAGVE